MQIVVTWLTVTAFAASGVLANSSKFRYGYSDCIDNKRTLFYYLESEGTCFANTTGQVLAKPPVHNLRCDVECGRGYYLGVNFSDTVPVSGCQRCPKGKYSLGGGQLFSQRTNAWSTPLPVVFQTDCMTQSIFSGHWAHNCMPWESSADGSYISSGENSDVLYNFEAARLYSTLRISATFVRDGWVTYKYLVDAEQPFDGLMFQIDDDESSALVSRSDGWQETIVQVSAGAHTLAWNYIKDYAGDAGADKAFIKVIEMVGTAWSDLHCHTCGGDMTNSGGSLCAFCGPNEYADAKSNSELDFTCYPCPPNTYAPKGSIGVSSCIEHHACSMDDVDETYTACKDGVRDVTYSWSQPQTCDMTLKKSIKLPESQKGIPCANCAWGYDVGEGDECVEVCDAGQVLAASGKCEECPAGTVVVNGLKYGVGTPDGWSFWPQIFDADEAQHAGWKLTKSGARFVYHMRDDRDTSNWSRPSRSALSFGLPFIHSGSLNLTYTLSGVPTFANNGALAWVELEVRDAADSDKRAQKKMDIPSAPNSNDGSTSSGGSDKTNSDPSIFHLLHGGENGTFSEVVHFNITFACVKEFKFVVRATSAQARRAIEAKVVSLDFTGTREGPGVSCDRCPSGYEPSNSNDDEEQAYRCRPTHIQGGAAKCIPCGANTYSSSGAASCAAPQVVTLNASSSLVEESSSSLLSSSAAVSSVLDGLQVTYNLSLLETLVWGNASWILESKVYGNSTSLQPTTPVEFTMELVADDQNYLFTGLFRPLGSGWLQQVPGLVVDQDVDTNSEVAYVVLANLVNPREAGNYFHQKSGVYGEVMCSAPAQWKLLNGGSHLDILPLESGAGVKVSLTGGSPCVDGKTMSTTFNFECDLSSGTKSKPVSASQDDDECNWDIVWKTAYACPICDRDYFNELRSACNGGEQLVSYARKLACYSEAESADAITTCTESAVVLDTKALYSVYAAVAIVGFVVLLLLMAILVVHRKYRDAYNNYMYLKGKMPTEKTQDDGSKETTFEFTPRSNVLHSSRPAVSDEGEKSSAVVDANDVDGELHSIQSV
ncbi:unnamed protein product [Peronospora belbahrii]|uniref:Tyrosine-protein kinase ephrin type A/B receptor-like domain-containing protein n=1 Tax=Peronospora belbahrii TaxID=622444 RepID=A0ABN8D753_9STRA|nr:unnamed protein product [Peronospora belbahrii]